VSESVPYHLDAFSKTKEFKAIAAKSTDLSEKWAKVLAAYESATFSDFDELKRQDVQSRLQRRFGKDIDFLFANYWQSDHPAAVGL